MIYISLTDFVDYVSKVGGTKYTKVKNIFNREPYERAFDFWLPMREAIIDLHRNGQSKKELDKVLLNLTDRKKINTYPTLVKEYKSWLGRKEIEWFDPPYKKWNHEDLSIRLNPELGLDINGNLYVIKLHFKSESLSQQKADLILLLLKKELKRRAYKDVNFAILDIRKKKLFENTKLGDPHIALLEAEANSFVSIWNSIEP